MIFNLSKLFKQFKIMLIMLSICTTLNLRSIDLNPESWINSPQFMNYVTKAGEATMRMAQDAADQVRRLSESKQKELKDEMKNLMYEHKISRDPERKKILEGQIKVLTDRIAKIEDRSDEVANNMNQLGTDTMKTCVTTASDVIKNKFESESRKAETAIQAEFTRRTAAENTKKYIKAFIDPKNAKHVLKYGSGISLAIFGAWHGTKFAADMLKHMYRNPNLAQDTSLVSYKDKFVRFVSNLFLKKRIEEKVSDVVLEKKLSERVGELAESVKNIVANGAYFQNMLFYGPPGTGKTMLAKRIAKNSGLEYIYFAGSSLDQYSIEEGMIVLTELFEFAKRSSKKLMIIIDEAEMLLANRTKELSEKSRKLLNHILTYTGTESKDYFVVALTNRPEDLDSAFLSRCDEKIEIGAPGFEQRKSILKMYINKFLVIASNLKPKRSWFTTNKATKSLVIQKNVFSERNIIKIAKKLENFTGRDISKLVIGIQNAAYATKDATITQEIIDKVIERKVAQKLRELNQSDKK